MNDTYITTTSNTENTATSTTAVTESLHSEFVDHANNVITYLKAEADKHKELINILTKLRSDIDFVHKILTNPILHEVEQKISKAIIGAEKYVAEEIEQKIPSTKRFFK